MKLKARKLFALHLPI